MPKPESVKTPLLPIGDLRENDCCGRVTEKQQLAFSLKFEYALGLAEIATRMGLDRKTAYEHIEAAKRKMDQARSNEKSKARRPKSEDE